MNNSNLGFLRRVFCKLIFQSALIVYDDLRDSKQNFINCYSLLYNNKVYVFLVIRCVLVQRCHRQTDNDHRKIIIVAQQLDSIFIAAPSLKMDDFYIR